LPDVPPNKAAFAEAPLTGDCSASANALFRILPIVRAGRRHHIVENLRNPLLGGLLAFWVHDRS
jgi:hypothetical protein